MKWILSIASAVLFFAPVPAAKADGMSLYQHHLSLYQYRRNQVQGWGTMQSRVQYNDNYYSSPPRLTEYYRYGQGPYPNYRGNPGYIIIQRAR